MKTFIGVTYLTLTASIWGAQFVVSKIVLDVVSPMILIWLRYIVAMVVLAVLALATRQSWRIKTQHMPLVVAIGIVGYVVSIAAQFVGTQLSTAQLGSVVTASTPAFMVVFAYPILKEQITWRKGVSLALATVGVVLVVGIGGHVDKSYQLGGIALLVAAITWALMSVLVKRVPEDYSQLVITTYVMLVAVIAMTPFVLGSLQQVEAVVSLGSSTLLEILYIGIVSTACAYYLWNKGLLMVEAGVGGLCFFFQPLVGTLLGWLILGERVGTTFWLGAVLIVAGVLLAIRNEQAGVTSSLSPHH